MSKFKTASCGVLCAAALTAAVTASSPAAAFQFLGINFGGEEESAQVEIIDPLPYNVRVDVAGGDRGLTSVVRNSSSVWTRRDTPASGAAGLISAGQDDYRSILAALYQRGFYSGAISVRINGREAADLQLTRPLARPATVQISVDPGPQFTFGQTDFINPAPAGFGPPAGLDSTAQQSFVPGSQARADVIAQAGEEEAEKWRYAGYPKADVADRDVIADHRRNQLDVTIRMDPGRRARFGPVTVTGDTGGVKPGFVRYMADIPEGGVFNPKAVEEATERLTRLGVFRAVRVQEAETISPDGTLPLAIETSPRRARRFGVGATLSTTEGLGLEGFWLHRQIGRRAERLRFDFSVNGIGTEGGVEDYDYEAGLTFRKPGFLDPDNSLVAGLSLRRLVFDDYIENAAEVELGLERRFDNRLEGSVFAEVSYSEVEDDGGIDEFLVFALPVRATYDARDVPLDARSGFYLEGELQPFYEFEFETAAVRAVVEGRTYFELVEDQTVLAFRARAGTIFGGDLTIIPPAETFYTGGGGSIRGYNYRSIGIEVNGETVGGRSTLELSAEVRQRITDSIELVGFADGGLVSAEEIPGFDADLRWGAGAGLRYDTALGPLRLDVAVPINPQPGDPDFAIYLGIGQAF